MQRVRIPTTISLAVQKKCCKENPSPLDNVPRVDLHSLEAVPLEPGGPERLDLFSNALAASTLLQGVNAGLFILAASESDNSREPGDNVQVGEGLRISSARLNWRSTGPLILLSCLVKHHWQRSTLTIWSPNE